MPKSIQSQAYLRVMSSNCQPNLFATSTTCDNTSIDESELEIFSWNTIVTQIREGLEEFRVFLMWQGFPRKAIQIMIKVLVSYN